MSDQIDRAIHETREFLAARRAPDLTAAVMSRIADATPLPSRRRPGLFGHLLEMLWAPREFSIRPAYALAAAACVAILVLVYVRQLPSGVPQTATAVDDPQVFVQFRLDTPASRVQLAGTFTNWEPRYDLRESAQH